MTRYEPAIDVDALDGDRHARAHRGRRPRPRLAAARPRRGGVAGTSAPTARGPTSTRRRVLPRAADGRRRLHRRRRDAARARPDLERRDRRGRRAQQRRAHPVRLRRPAHRRGRGRRARAGSSRRAACAASSSTPPCRASTRATSSTTRCTRRSRSSACPRSSTPGRPASAPGCPAGYGLRLGLSNPMLLDPVAADFPDLQIIMAHPSVPWQDEALVGRDPQAQHLDRPVRLEPEVLPGSRSCAHANSLPQDARAVRLRLPAAHARPLDRATPSRPRSSPRCMPGILKDNAARLLGLVDRDLAPRKEHP